MNIILSALPRQKKLCFYNQYELERFLDANEGEELIVELKLASKTTPKLKMYSYYQKIILSAAMRGYERIGYNGIDRVVADYKLKALYAKDYIVNVNNGEKEVFLMDKSRMTKDELWRYISNCIFFIESELGIPVPDSSEYKLNQETGRSFTSVKNIK